MDWKRRVGRNLNEHRRRKGWSQQTLAGEANLSLRYLAGVERGEENPTLTTLITIADALQIHPRELLA